MSFGEPHHHFERIDSTNTYARALAAEGAAARDGRHRRGADRGTRAPGADLDRAARQSPPLLGDRTPA